MTALHRQLEALGLTPNQSLVYLELVRTKEAKAGEIIKKTGLHRNLVYVALRDLARKKLITSSKVGGVLMYKTLSPARLLADAQEKERIAKNVIEELDTLSKQSNGQEIIVYEGLDEFRRHALRSMSLARHGELIRYLGTSQHWHVVAGPGVEKEMLRIQKAKKLRMHGISRAPFPEIQAYAQVSKGLTEVRYNPLISSDTNNIEILDDRVCIQSFIEPYFVVEIVNKELAKNYQNYFDFLWKNSK